MNMNRTLAFIVLVVVLGGGVYFVYTRHGPAAAGPTAQEDPIVVTAATEQTIAETTADYSIDIKYPAFGAEAIDAKIRATLDDLVNGFKNQAVADKPATSGFRAYELSGSYNNVYIGQDAVSAQMLMYQDFGGAHGLPFVIGFNFDPETGEELTLDDALSMTGLTLQELAAQSLSKLKAKLGEEVIFPEGADPKIENYSSFVVTPSSVKFIFQAYQVAPYAAGMPEIEFPKR